jgi:hypothetical protein
VDHIDLGPDREVAKVGLKFANAGLGRFEGFGFLCGSGLGAGALFALIAFCLAALDGLGFPLLSALLHFGVLAHNRFSDELADLRPNDGMASKGEFAHL